METTTTTETADFAADEPTVSLSRAEWSEIEREFMSLGAKRALVRDMPRPGQLWVPESLDEINAQLASSVSIL